MRKIKVLIVDDSAFMRKVIGDMLSRDAEIEVVDSARDGEWALKKLKTLEADVITMDVEMPRMNGLEALRAIKEAYEIPVIMLSSLTMDGADTTIRALELGAFDFVLKPTRGIGFDIDTIKDELISKIKYCARMGGKKPFKAEGKAAHAHKRAKEWYHSDIRAVCIATSTGGPRALASIMPMFPEDFKLPILIVQHMPAGFTRAFAERLDGISKIRVVEAKDNEKIEGGTAYIAPGGYHMEVQRGGTLALNEDPPVHGVRPCADKLFISAVNNIEGRLIGVVMTGMGRDGTNGLDAIKKSGGICIAEDESTCTIFGMPKSAIEKGSVHIVVPLEKIVGEILDIIRA